MTIDVCPGRDALAVPSAILTSGLTVPSKNPDGYDTVMLAFWTKLVAATKLTVTGTFAREENRSDGTMTNDVMVTFPPMLPELTPELAKSSEV